MGAREKESEEWGTPALRVFHFVRLPQRAGPAVFVGCFCSMFTSKTTARRHPPCIGRRPKPRTPGSLPGTPHGAAPAANHLAAPTTLVGGAFALAAPAGTDLRGVEVSAGLRDASTVASAVADTAEAQGIPRRRRSRPGAASSLATRGTSRSSSGKCWAGERGSPRTPHFCGSSIFGSIFCTEDPPYLLIQRIEDDRRNPPSPKPSGRL